MDGMRMLGGKYLLITGPSGVGKTKLVRALERIGGGQVHPVSMYTTRPVRPPVEGEEPDSYRIHLSREAFEQMRKQNEFLESAEVYGHYYGTPLALFFKGKDVHRKLFVLEVDLRHGLSVLTRIFRDPFVLALVPSRFKDLSIRLARRGREDERSVQVRLRAARDEIAAIKGLAYCKFIHHLVRTKEVTEGEDPQYEAIARDVLVRVGRHTGMTFLRDQ